jgi:hypothetical protein
MFSLRTVDWRTDVALPLAILLAPLAVSAFVWDQVLLLLFPVALVVGMVVHPRHLWLVWIGTTVLMWAVYGVAVLTGFQEEPASDPSQGETIWTFAIEAFVWTAVLVLVPLWGGRLFDRRAFSRGRRRDLESGSEA